jgi:DnaJ-class molecular chaperone
MPTKKPKRDIFADPSPYGTYEGPPGHADEWRGAFGEAWRMNTGEATRIVGEGSPWEILGIPVGSRLAVIKEAFYKLIMIHHPDKGGDPEVAKSVIAAWTILKDK